MGSAASPPGESEQRDAWGLRRCEYVSRVCSESAIYFLAAAALTTSLTTLASSTRNARMILHME